jgi:TPR repeat protein
MQPVNAQSFKPDYDAGNAALRKGEYATALKHWMPLAKQGHALAQFRLGFMYSLGWGVDRNVKEAAKWSRKAAVQGDADAQRNLGLSYRDGQGLLQDLVMAYVWLNISATDGGSRAKKFRDEVLAKLTTSERELARKLSKLCLRKPAKCPEYSDD